jgi:hypothetical protein
MVIVSDHLAVRSRSHEPGDLRESDLLVHRFHDLADWRYRALSSRSRVDAALESQREIALAFIRARIEVHVARSASVELGPQCA